MYNAECIAIKDIKPGLKNINVIFIVLEVCSKLSIPNDCMFVFSFVYMYIKILFVPNRWAWPQSPRRIGRCATLR